MTILIKYHTHAADEHTWIENLSAELKLKIKLPTVSLKRSFCQHLKFNASRIYLHAHDVRHIVLLKHISRLFASVSVAFENKESSSLMIMMTTNFIHHLLQRNQGHLKQSKPWLQNFFLLRKPGETEVFFTSDRQSREGSTSTFNLVGKNRKIK